LLSWLAAQALQPVRETVGPEAFIFPYLQQQDEATPTSYPNRFVAVVPSSQAAKLGQQSIEAARAGLGRVVTFAMEQLELHTGYPRELADQQVATYLQGYWTFLPLDTTQPYGPQYRLLEQQLGARKALRDFEATESPGYRCDLIPALAALPPEPDARPRAMRQFWEQLSTRQPYRYLQAGESLSAIALGKRFFPAFQQAEARRTSSASGEDGPQAFPSTSSFATADFKAAVLQRLPEAPALARAVTAYEEAMQPLIRPLAAMEAPVPRLQLLAEKAGVDTFQRIGGLWLFGESFDRDAAAVPEDTSVTDDALQAGYAACKALVRAARAEGISPPSRYYGVLLLDGDKMGAWLSGERRPTEEMKVDRAYHQAVSRALGHFAGSRVPPLVEKSYLGQLVYSGGDDVMAFCSRLDTLPLARALRAAFSSHLGPQGEVDWTRDRPFTPLTETGEPTLGHTASASAGVVIAHHMYPLSEVLREGRRAEKKEAKDVLGRDALAVSVLKRGGQRETAGGRWRTGDLDLVPTLEHYASYLRRGDISTGFLHTLGTDRDALSHMGSQHGEAVHLEVRRIFARQSEKDAAPFMPLLERLINHHGLEKTIDLLALAQFIARGELT
jgi:CRISPR-associated protein Cmr2